MTSQEVMRHHGGVPCPDTIDGGTCTHGPYLPSGMDAHGRTRDDFVTLDSGRKQVHSDGMQRDTQAGKPMFGLMFPRGTPWDDQPIVRLAALYTRGAEKYGDRNWEKAASADSEAHIGESFLRHALKFYLGVQDGEDHAAAVMWNVIALDHARRNLARHENPELAEKHPLNDPAWEPSDVEVQQAKDVIERRAFHKDRRDREREVAEQQRGLTLPYPADPPGSCFRCGLSLCLPGRSLCYYCQGRSEP